MDIALIIQSLAAKAPILVAVLSAMGILRLVLKPVFSILHSVADATVSDKDNLLLDKAEKSAPVKGLLWVLDYLFSLKLIK